MAAADTSGDLALEVAELRAVVVELAGALRRLDDRAASLEQRLPARPVPAAAVTRPGGADIPRPRRSGRAQPPGRAHQPRHRGPGHPARRPGPSAVAGRSHAGRHRRTDPRVRRRERAAEMRYAAATLAMLLPWLVCVGGFAVALGLVALSTFE